MKKFTFLSVFALLSLAMQGQSLNKSLSTVTSITEIAEGVILNTAHGNVKVQVYSPTVIRIQASKENSFNTSSYAVIANPSKGIFKLQKEESKLIIHTDSCILEISKNPLRFILKDKAGNVLNKGLLDIFCEHNPL